MTEKKRALLLFSNLLGDLPHHEPYLPSSVDKAVKTIDGLIAESEKEGRLFPAIHVWASLRCTV